MTLTIDLTQNFGAFVTLLMICSSLQGSFIQSSLTLSSQGKSWGWTAFLAVLCFLGSIVFNLLVFAAR